MFLCIMYSYILCIILNNKNKFCFLGLASSSDRKGPYFMVEPDPKVEFMNSTGASVVCSSQGNPLPFIRWIKKDGSSVTDITGLRHVRPDGTLVFSPFRAEEYRQDVHATIYRCIASNVVGSISSRDVNVRAGKLKYFSISSLKVFI